MGSRACRLDGCRPDRLSPSVAGIDRLAQKNVLVMERSGYGCGEDVDVQLLGDLDILGEQRVNVLMLNLNLDGKR
jgi:K+-transporting ATPase c subunit